MKPKISVVLLPFVLCGFSFIAELKNEKGNDLYKKGQVHKARSKYLSALKSDPKSPEIAYNLGNALYKENAFKESLGAYSRGAKAPKDPAFASRAFYNLGNALYRNQDPPQAIEQYKQALRSDPKNEDAKYNLELLLKQSQKDKDQKKDQNKDPKDQNKEGQSGNGKESPQNQEQKQDRGEEGQPGEPKSPQEQSSAGEKPGESPSNDEKKESGSDRIPGEGQKEEPKPKTEAEQRAEQLLNALENQEQQVLKFQNDPKKARYQVRRVSEKDW